MELKRSCKYMDPITNSKYSDDFRKFVLQDVGSRPLINPNAVPVKPFKLEKNAKTKKQKKDSEKKDERNPSNLTE